MPRHEIHVIRLADGVCPAYKDDDRKVEVRVSFHDKGKRSVSFNNYPLSTFLDRLYWHLKYEAATIENLEEYTKGDITDEQFDQWDVITTAMTHICAFDLRFLRTYKSVDWGNGCYAKHWNKLINHLKPWIKNGKTL